MKGRCQVNILNHTGNPFTMKASIAFLVVALRACCIAAAPAEDSKGMFGDIRHVSFLTF